MFGSPISVHQGGLVVAADGRQVESLGQGTNRQCRVVLLKVKMQWNRVPRREAEAAGRRDLRHLSLWPPLVNRDRRSNGAEVGWREEIDLD